MSSQQQHEQQQQHAPDPAASGAFEQGPAGRPRPGDEPPREPLPDWRPDPAMIAALGDEEGGAGFRIRPPRGYVLSRSENAGAEREYAWEGTPRVGGTRPYLMAGLISWNAGAREEFPLERLFDIFLAAIRARRPGWTATPPQPGCIGGIPFVRARWAGDDAAAGRRMHGFLYVGRFHDGTGRARVAVLSSQDAEPYAFESLRVTGAAALTFRPAAEPG